MPRVGRPEHTVWRCYKKEHVPNSKSFRGVCLGCQKEIAGLTYRLLRHADSCERLHQINLWSAPKPIKKESQQSLLVLKMGKAEIVEAQRKVARFVYSSNLPFSVVRNKEFVELMKSLSPTFQMPSAEKVANDLLDEEYKTQRLALKEKFKISTTSCQLTDGLGWKTHLS